MLRATTILGPDLPRRLRSLFGTATFLCLALAALAFGATVVTRMALERQAVAGAGRVVSAVLEPALRPGDLARPVAGRRFEELRTLVDEQVPVPPYTGVEVWNRDGTIVFADRRSLLGGSPGSARTAIRTALSQGSARSVEGDTFRAFIEVRLQGGAAAVVELDRSHAAMAADADARWRPWAERGITFALVSFGLYLLAIVASIVERRRRARAVERVPEPPRRTEASPPIETEVPWSDPHASVPRRRSDDGDLHANAPAYVLPGFREQVEARKEAEDALAAAQSALAASEQERLRLLERLRQAEAELEQANRRLTQLGATATR